MWRQWQLHLAEMKNLDLFTITNKATVLFRVWLTSPIEGQNCRFCKLWFADHIRSCVI